jgi:asparagine synthase (glutamine-hydrolysing)
VLLLTLEFGEAHLGRKIMCGICGIWSFSGTPVSEETLASMNIQMVHRGPDDEGSLVREGVGMAMRRLSIIDLFHGHQPLSNEDQTIWVVLNGEIYNYRELKADLASHGHIFLTNSDTEVIVHGYEQWGMGLFSHLNGMFAFAIYDALKDEMLIARDRVGKKPLYYWQDGDKFAFASEIKALLQLPELERLVDEDALQLYLMLGYAPAPYTMFKSVKKLGAGCCLRLYRGRPPEEKQYWDLTAASVNGDEPPTMESAVEEFLDLFYDSVRLRLVSDVPVGLLLSGGLDSSSVMAAMRRTGAGDIKSFSVAFVEQDINEASFARTAAVSLGSDHYELLVENCSPDIFQTIVHHTDEPIADPALVPTYLLSRLASEHVKVVLTGEGADELFGGYFYHPLYRKTDWVDRLPKMLKPEFFTAAASAYNAMTHRTRFHPRSMWAWTLPIEARPLAWSAIFTGKELQEYALPFRNKGKTRLDPVSFIGEIARRAPGEDWLSRLLYYELKVPLVDNLLMKVDKMSMAASIEARAPFLDYRMVEFANRLPARLKLDGDGNKLVLRRAMESILPMEISSRAKHPFHVPIRRWLMNDLRQLFWDSVRGDSFQALEAVDIPSLKRLWADMEAGVPGRAHALWLLFSLAVWADQFLGTKPASSPRAAGLRYPASGSYPL